MEKKEEQKKMINASGIIDKIIALTFTRHSGLSESDYLKEIKSKEESEEKAVIGGKFALLSAITKEMLIANDKIKLIDGTLSLLKGDFDKKGE